MGPLESHYADLRARVEATIAVRTTAEWQAILDARGVPAGAVALPVEMLDAAQAAANDMIHRYQHPALGQVTVLGSPVAQGPGGFAPAAPTPAFGSEVGEILAWAGFGPEDVQRLRASGAVTPRPA